MTKRIANRTRMQELHEITGDVQGVVRHAGIRNGLYTMIVQHYLSESDHSGKRRPVSAS